MPLRLRMIALCQLQGSSGCTLRRVRVGACDVAGLSQHSAVFCMCVACVCLCKRPGLSCLRALVNTTLQRMGRGVCRVGPSSMTWYHGGCIQLIQCRSVKCW